MKKIKTIVASILIAAATLSVSAFAACGSETTYTFEAEKATLITADGVEAYGDWAAYYTLATEDVESASGGLSVGFFSYDGNTITFTIESNKAVTGVELVICAASATASDYDWTTWQPTGMADYDTADHDLLVVNGSNVALTGTFPGSSADDADYAGYYNWATVSTTIDLVSGTNTISLVADGTSLNIDYIQITTSATLTWTETNN